MINEKLKQKARYLYDLTHKPGVLFSGIAKTYQSATLEEIENHLILLDKVGNEYKKTLSYEQYPVGITENDLREKAKIYWTKGRRIEKAKKAKEETFNERMLLHEAFEFYPNNAFLLSVENQIGKKHRLSNKQREIIDDMVKRAKSQLSPDAPESKTTKKLERKPRVRKPKPEKKEGASLPELQRIHAGRSPQSRAMDESQPHSLTIDADSLKSKNWISDQGLADIKGIDTKSNTPARITEKQRIRRSSSRISGKIPRISRRTPRIR